MCWSTITRIISRTPAGIRVLRPMLGEGLLIAEGRAWKHQRRTLAPAFTPRAVGTLVPHMVAATDRDRSRKLQRNKANGPVDLREAMQRMTLEIAGRTMFSFGMDRHGATLRDFVMEYGDTAGAAAFSRSGAAAGLADAAGFCPRALPQALDAIRRHADGGAPRRRQEADKARRRAICST